MKVPIEPQEFFEEFFPRQFDEHRASLGVGTTSSAVSFFIEGCGFWSFEVRDSQLVVERESRPDVRLQLVFSREDFEAIVIRRAFDELASHGVVSSRSLGPFRLLFGLEKKRMWSDAEAGNSLLFVIDDGGVSRKMHVVPGPGPVPERARVALHMTLDNFLALLNRESPGMTMFMLRRLRVSGDLAFALRANALLG